MLTYVQLLRYGHSQRSHQAGCRNHTEQPHRATTQTPSHVDAAVTIGELQVSVAHWVRLPRSLDQMPRPYASRSYESDSHIYIVCLLVMCMVKCRLQRGFWKIWFLEHMVFGRCIYLEVLVT